MKQLRQWDAEEIEGIIHDHPWPLSISPSTRILIDNKLYRIILELIEEE
jgi:hypothetical protein